MKLTSFSETAKSLDPRAKFVSLLVLSLIVLLLGSAAVLLCVSLLLVAFSAAARIRVISLVRRMTTVAWFVIVITGTSLFSVSGTVLFEAAGLYATVEGAELGLVYSGRILLLLWLSSLFVWTTSTVDMIDGVAATFRMVRGAGSLVVFGGVAITIVPLMVRTAERVRLAQIARGAPQRGGFFSQVRFAASAALPLFGALVRSADDLALAMDARCLDTRVQRSHYRRLVFRGRDWLFLLLVGSIAAATLLLAFNGS